MPSDNRAVTPIPTLLGHIAVPLAIGLAAGARTIPTRLLALGAAAACLPDVDVVAFRLGIAYSSEFGHRGFSHSLLFALLLGSMAIMIARRLQVRPLVAFGFVALCTASHGLLDMLTDGGEGIAVLWPWSEERFFAPWRVIEASPLSLRRLLGPRGLEVLQSELLWVWLPAAGMTVSAILLRRSVSARRSSAGG